MQSVLAHLTGTNHLIASLLYGAGLRLMEGIRLRVKDIDLSANQLTIREGKGAYDRLTMLPQRIQPALQEQLLRARVLNQQDLKEGFLSNSSLPSLSSYSLSTAEGKLDELRHKKGERLDEMVL